MKDILWTRPILDEFLHLAMLTDTEEQILRTRIAGWSRVKQSMEMNMSLASIDAAIRLINQKYDAVQPHSKILPMRKKHKKT